jgi:hypothetical protein
MLEHFTELADVICRQEEFIFWSLAFLIIVKLAKTWAINVKVTLKVEEKFLYGKCYGVTYTYRQITSLKAADMK